MTFVYYEKTLIVYLRLQFVRFYGGSACKKSMSIKFLFLEMQWVCFQKQRDYNRSYFPTNLFQSCITLRRNYQNKGDYSIGRVVVEIGCTSVLLFLDGNLKPKRSYNLLTECCTFWDVCSDEILSFANCSWMIRVACTIIVSGIWKSWKVFHCCDTWFLL